MYFCTWVLYINMPFMTFYVVIHKDLVLLVIEVLKGVQITHVINSESLLTSW